MRRNLNLDISAACRQHPNPYEESKLAAWIVRGVVTGTQADDRSESVSRKWWIEGRINQCIINNVRYQLVRATTVRGPNVIERQSES